MMAWALGNVHIYVMVVLMKAYVKSFGIVCYNKIEGFWGFFPEKFLKKYLNVCIIVHFGSTQA